MRKILFTLVGLIIFSTNVLPQAWVDGYCFLKNQTDNSGTKIIFQADSPGAVTDSTNTNISGHYQIAVSPGFYNICFIHEGYKKGEILGQNCFSPLQLPDVTMTLMGFSGQLTGIISRGSYFVDGDIYVESGDSLIIEPGTIFQFNGEYSFEIYGYLYAVGTEIDSIRFR